jgi:hypothetical protein
VALLSLLQNTARIKQSRAAHLQARQTNSNSGCPAKIEEPFNLASLVVALVGSIAGILALLVGH